MLRPWTFVGFTGHRDLAQPGLVSAHIERALKRIAQHSQAPLAAVSSAARGGDTLFAEAAATWGMPWQLLLPCPKERFFNQTDFSAENLRRILPLIGRAFHTQVEEPAPAGTGGEVTAFQACSARTVDECDYLIAVWDGLPGRPGGTADTIAYARLLKRPLLIIQANGDEITEENFPDPVQAAPAGPVPVGDPVAGGLPELQRTLEHYDEMAQVHAPEARDLVARVIFLHLAATAVGMFAPVFGILTWVALLPAVFKVGVLGYAGKLARRQHHAKDQWLRHRLVAELCRAALGTWPLSWSERAHQAILLPGMRDWQRSLRLWRLVAPPAPKTVAEQRDAYLEGRFDSPTTGQIPYFERQHRRALARYERWSTVASRTTSAAIVCAVAVIAKALWTLLAGHGAAHHTWWGDGLKFLSLVLPLVSAAIFTWLASSDCQRRVERSAEMLARLHAARERIRQSTTWGALERQVSEVETALLLEVLEWHSLSHYSSGGH